MGVSGDMTYPTQLLPQAIYMAAPANSDNSKDTYCRLLST